ncbi:MAG TPA: relaxase/mobilization nuclease domain-containing protein, partial [Cyclobacteriaceae bacterium]|nr:relaxase/mobilization nuclease domain-containing protein [Cyclobacteriaceae bacterium]
MKIIISHSAHVRHSCRYNEAKVDMGIASVIGGNMAIGREAGYVLDAADLSAIIAKNSENPSAQKHDAERVVRSINEKAKKTSLKLERLFNHIAFKRRKSSKLKNRFSHIKISLSPEDRNLTTRKLRLICETALEKLGYKNCPFVLYQHKDTLHPHVHIVVSRVTFSGDLVSNSYLGLKAKRIEETIEKDFELVGSYERIIQNGVRNPQKWERLRMDKTGFKSMRSYAQIAILESIKDRPTLDVLLRRLERRGIELWRSEFTRKGITYSGLSYTIKPKLVKYKFKSDKADRINKIDHVAGDIMINEKGFPELCPNNSKPAKLKPFSFRAANLGPAFQEKNLFSFLLSVNPETLRSITIDKTGVGKNRTDLYQRESFTKNEVPELSSLILAAEMNSSSRMVEHISKVEVDSILPGKLAMDKELALINQVLKFFGGKPLSQNIGGDKLDQLMTWFKLKTKSTPSGSTLKL